MTDPDIRATLDTVMTLQHNTICLLADVMKLLTAGSSFISPNQKERTTLELDDIMVKWKARVELVQKALVDAHERDEKSLLAMSNPLRPPAGKN